MLLTSDGLADICHTNRQNSSKANVSTCDETAASDWLSVAVASVTANNTPQGEIDLF